MKLSPQRVLILTEDDVAQYADQWCNGCGKPFSISEAIVLSGNKKIRRVVHLDCIGLGNRQFVEDSKNAS